MYLGKLNTFPIENLPQPREQSLKILEEAAEVFSAIDNEEPIRSIIDECADVIMATCNLMFLAGGYTDISEVIKRCELRQMERGRYDIQEPTQKGKRNA